jgi:hypothetical protein
MHLWVRGTFDLLLFSLFGRVSYLLEQALLISFYAANYRRRCLGFLGFGTGTGFGVFFGFKIMVMFIFTLILLGFSGLAFDIYSFRYY